MKKNTKKIVVALALLATVVTIVVWYLFNEKFSDTANEKAAYTFNAINLLHEFEKNDSLANKKYADKIITVNGKVFEAEAADTTVNIKMTDTTTGSYIIFAFQQQHLAEAKNLNEGDNVSIKGSCSGGAYSKILETEFINFKRCTINK